MANLENLSKENLVEEIPQWKLAKQGLQLILNNKFNEGEAVLKNDPNSIQLFAGYTFAVFMDALMTFEDDKLNLALATLKEIEGRCTSEAGWLRTVKTKILGSNASLSLEDQLEHQIILADSQVCIAILTFLQQDFTGYFKGSWVLRKAWKIYQQTYIDIKTLYNEIVGDLPEEIDIPHSHQSFISVSDKNPESTSDENPESTSDENPELTFDEWDFPIQTTSNSPSNGYIQTNNPNLPLSNSYPNNLKVDKCKNVTNKCNCLSNNNLCATQNTNNTQCRLLNYQNTGNICSECTNVSLKKSISVNSALYSSSNRDKRSNGFFSQLSPFHSTLSLSYFTSAFNIFSTEKPKTCTIDKETITRLMGAVSFGFGLFQLGISLLPPSLLRLTNFLGFGGNRQTGLVNLMYAREGTDMRAPLATLSLLWYHTIVRPFYALDGSNVQAGVEVASQLIAESEEEYGESALFLFFKGRVYRLKSDIPNALQSFQASVNNSCQREIKILSLHEVGWCNLIKNDYVAAEQTFQVLKMSSRWSRAFYGYLATICAGSCSKITDIKQLEEMKSLIDSSSKGTQLELFLSRRFNWCPNDNNALLETTEIFWKMFVYELLYLWNTLASCNTESIHQIIEDCKSVSKYEKPEPMTGLSYLVEGNCYFILNKVDDAVASFRKCLEIRNSKPHNAQDAHVSAFAQYELGTVLIKNSDTKEEGKQLLSKMSTYKDYDFEQRLTVRVHSILKNS